MAVILGFLLVTVFIITLLGTVDFFNFSSNSRDVRRWADTSNVIVAFKKYKQQNNGQLPSVISSTTPTEIYMITGGEKTMGCATQNDKCLFKVTDDSHCLDLSLLVKEGYLTQVPVSPNDKIWRPDLTGYTFQRENNIITIRSCEAEETEAIWAAQ